MSAGPARPVLRGLYAITPDGGSHDELEKQVGEALRAFEQLLVARGQDGTPA